MHFSDQCPEHNSKTNNYKVLKLGVEISYKWYGFGLKGQRSSLGLTACVRTLSVSSAVD